MKDPRPRRKSIFRRIGDRFEAGFEKLAHTYEGALDWALAHRGAVVSALLLFAIASLFLYPFVGRDFFPSVDAGTLPPACALPAGHTPRAIRGVFPTRRGLSPATDSANELNVIDDNIGLPNNINLARSDSVTAGPSMAKSSWRSRQSIIRPRLSEDDSSRVSAQVSQPQTLCAAGRHREPDSQLRTARAN